jgi:hypothetical protein
MVKFTLWRFVRSHRWLAPSRPRHRKKAKETAGLQDPVMFQKGLMQLHQRQHAAVLLEAEAEAFILSQVDVAVDRDRQSKERLV